MRMHLHYGDLTDATNLIRIIQEAQPEEIYHLAAQSHVMVSFETPEYMANADALGDTALPGWSTKDRLFGIAPYPIAHRASCWMCRG